MEKFFNRHTYYTLGLCAALALAFLLRAFRLTAIPNIIHIDEAALGYNAWCLSHFGVDRYLNELPVYPQNFYGGQSPLYTYLVSLFILTIGRGNLSIFIVRLPGLVFSMLVVIFSVKTVRLIFDSRRLALACAFLVSVFPYFIMHGRLGFDCNLMLGCCVMAMYSLAKYAATGRLSRLCVCGAAFGLIMYSYATAYILVPIYLFLAALYLLFVRKLTLPRTLLWAACVIVSSLPILLFIFSLLLKLEPFSFLCFHVYPVAAERITDVGVGNFWENVWLSIQTTLFHGKLIMDSIPKYGTMYGLSVPFIVTGFFVSFYHLCNSLRTRRFHYSALFFLFYLSCLITMGFIEADEVYRANFFFTAYVYFLILGISSVLRLLQSYRQVFAAALGGAYLLWALSFARYYFGIYEIVSYPNSLYFIPATEAVSFAENELSAETIYIDSMGFQEIQLFFSPISPYEWAGLRTEEGYGRYRFNVNYLTPIAVTDAYLTRKENAEFINTINSFEIPHETIEYENYYLFYFTGSRPQPRP